MMLGAPSLHSRSSTQEVKSSQPDVSVLLTCFNQQSVVADAIDSVLGQVFDGAIEIVVADDASSDGTLDVAARRLAGSRQKTTLLPSPVNRGATANFFRGIDACRAPFIAVLEGDDFWTIPDKLAVQARLLAQHPGWTACACNFMILDMVDGSRKPRADILDRITLCQPVDLIGNNLPGNMSATMYRRSALALVPDVVRNARCGDWLLNISLTGLGPLAFMHRPMSVYRKSRAGIWSGLSAIAQIELLLDIVPEYDAVTGGRYRAAFARKVASYEAELAQLRAAQASA